MIELALCLRRRPSSPQALNSTKRSGFSRAARPDAIRAAAVAGLGLAQVLEVFVQEEIARGKLEVAARDHESAPRTVYALYTRDKAALPKVRVCLEFLSAALRAGAVRKAR